MQTVTLPRRRERFTSACIPPRPAMSTIAPDAHAGMRIRRTSTSAPELPGERREYPPLVVPSTPSPRHRPPALRSLGQGRRRRDGATGTTGTGLLLATTARSTTPEIGARRVNCRLPGARCCARSEPARGSARLLTARTSARPDFPFSRLISRLDWRESRTGSAVRERRAVAWRVHNGRAVGTPKKRLRRERQALLRTINTSSSRPGASVSRFPAQFCALPALTRRGSWSLGCAALRTFRANQEAKPCRSCAQKARRSACNWPPSTCSLTARSTAKRKGWRVMRMECKIKGLSALLSLSPIVTALAALTSALHVRQKSYVLRRAR